LEAVAALVFQVAEVVELLRSWDQLLFVAPRRMVAEELNLRHYLSGKVYIWVEVGAELATGLLG